MLDKPNPRTGFWGGFLRRGNSSAHQDKPNVLDASERTDERIRSPKPILRWRPEPSAMAGAQHHSPEARLRPRPRARRVARFSDENMTESSREPSPPVPLISQWPPSGISSQEALSRDRAIALIARGAPLHKGYKRAVPHASSDYYALYAVSSGNRGDETDRANAHDAMVQLMTFRMAGPSEIMSPWSTLEQPSCAYQYGARPGTITLNHWASMASELPRSIAMRDPAISPRPLTLEQVFERLQELQLKRHDVDRSALYRSLYKSILRDTGRILSPHRGVEKQITDLILVLSRPIWIDFTDPKNQVVTRFIFDPVPENHHQYLRWFYQLLLSIELNLRIHDEQHSEYAKGRLLQQIPPKIRWNLALASRWSDYVRIDNYGSSMDDVKLRLRLKKRQVKMLKKFATRLKWPNLGATLEALRETEVESASAAVSSDAFAFFSGLVLPGPAFPFIIMNTLIDTDPDEATDELALLSHLHPNCGFQYRNSYTYWATSCIVGKVLAPTCLELAGWVGPACPTSDLGRSQIARIRTRKLKQVMQLQDVESMGQRSDPLGPPSEVYPVQEYMLVQSGAADRAAAPDTARVELLILREVPTQQSSGPKLFDALVQVAVNGVSWPLKLTYDVSFVCAWPCSDGPHALFFDYIYKTVSADEILVVDNWGGLHKKTSRKANARATSLSMTRDGHDVPNGKVLEDAKGVEQEDEEEVLVVEAFGVPDHEVLVRAWCTHWGLSALVADVDKTCAACAIRECYAAALTVLILVNGGVSRGRGD